MKNRLSYKILSVIISLAILFCAIPLGSLTVTAANSTSIADPQTLDNWKDWFSQDSSRYAGGVYVDKSVFTATEAERYYANDIADKISFGTDNFGNENFLVSLSAIGSNTEVIGYSTTPTDTMLVLDLSSSMSASEITALVQSTNNAIDRLLKLNRHNRVGVVLYSGNTNQNYAATANTATVLLALNRYETNVTERVNVGTSWNPSYVTNNIYVQYSNGSVRVATKNNGGVKIEGKNGYLTGSKAASGGTYLQNGIYKAWQEFNKVTDITIPEGLLQGGTKRMPILVLMSDGAPTIGTENYYNVNTSDTGDGTSESARLTFLTQLTAAWAKAKVAEKYEVGVDDVKFYTLGLGTSSSTYATDVLNPSSATAMGDIIDYWDDFIAGNRNQDGEVGIEVRTNQYWYIPKEANSVLTNASQREYVTEYWAASNADGLISAFEEIVEEIIIQSRYYATLVESNNHEMDGFISFTDEIGTHMEVKNIKGIHIGKGTLVTGDIFAQSMTNNDMFRQTASGALGTPTELGNTLLDALQARFNINATHALTLLNAAVNNGFISYSSSGFSNYVAWYADENNNYLKEYNGEDYKNTTVAGAKYLVKSYLYLGDITQNHIDTDMLYMLIRVREDIKTGRQIVDGNLPAALLPMITYSITVEGDTLTNDSIRSMTTNIDDKAPACLLYEVGLKSDITPYNIVEKMDGRDFRKNADGSYSFYTNRWRSNDGAAFTIPTTPDMSVFNHGILNTTVTQFIPSLQNERYYYIADTTVRYKDGDNYYAYTDNATPTGTGYYHIHQYVTKTATGYKLETAYNPITENALKFVKRDGANWIIPAGTPKSFFVRGTVLKDTDANDNVDENYTKTLEWSNIQKVVYHEDHGHKGYHVLNYLGNNGKITAYPAQGIKLTKTVAQKVENAPDSFTFDIELRGNDIALAYQYRHEKANGKVETGNVDVNNNTITVTLGDGDVYYINGLEVGTSYKVTERYNTYYAGSSQNSSGTVSQKHTVYDVDFVNAPKGYGSLLVEKDVTHPFTTISPDLAGKEFDITVTFNGSADDLAQIRVNDATSTDNGHTYSFKLADGHDILFTNIPEGVTYTVEEKNIPTGFTLVTQASDLEGTIAKDTQSEVLLVNDYRPASVFANITVQGEKNIVGRAWNDSIDAYQIALHPVTFGGQGTVSAGNPTIVDVVKAANGADYTIDMGSIPYTKIGTYNYLIYEVVPNNAVKNISYDSSFGMISVEVVDKGTGALIVDHVTVLQNTAELSGNANDGWIVEKNFTNTYMATTLRIPVYKKVVKEGTGTSISDHNGGIMFGMYSSPSAATPTYNALTDASGLASFTFNVTQSDYDTVKYFYIREIAPSEESTVTGMTYNTDIEYVVAIDWSNGTSPVVKYYRYNAAEVNGLGAEITDINANPFTITNTFDDNVISNPLEFGGKKTLNNGAIRQKDSFTFTLYETDATFNLANATIRDTKTVNGNVSTSGEFSFTNITFDNVGTKYLVIAENKGDESKGVGYDTTLYHITVDVSKVYDANNKAILKATATRIHQVGNGDVAADQINFNNTYTIKDTEKVAIPAGKKNLTGRELISGEFRFGIFKQGETTTNIPYAVNLADGTINFPELSFTENDLGEHVYEIREIDDGKGGVDYSTATYTVTINIFDDTNGGLNHSVTVTDNKQIVFDNTYKANSSAPLTLSGTKDLDGRNLVDNEFTFTLFEADSSFNIIPNKNPVATATNKNGTFSMNLIYNHGEDYTHYYVLSENIPTERKGVHYDTREYHITVIVIDDGEGQMFATVRSITATGTHNTFNPDQLGFVNQYSAESVTLKLEASKQLKNKALAPNMFKFDISDENDTVIATGENDAEGNIVFPDIIIESAGTYEFTIKEANGGKTIDNIDYDQTVYSLTVVVEDNLEGKLEIVDAKLKKDGKETDEIVFINTYNEPTPDPTPTHKPDDSDTSPKTNDTSLFGLWLAAFFVSGGLLAGFALKNKKEQEAE